MNTKIQNQTPQVARSETKLAANDNSPWSVMDTNRLLSEQELLTRIKVCRRTLGHYKRRGLIPVIKLRRRCFYIWDDVVRSMQRQTRGGNL